MKIRTKIILVVILLAMVGGLGYAYYSYKEQKRIEYEMWLNETEPRYLANDRPQLTITDEEGNELTVIRGTEVQYKINKTVDEEHPEKKEIVLNDVLYYVDESYLVNDVASCVTEKVMYTEKPEEVFLNTGMLEIAYSINKNIPVEIIGFNQLNEDGTVDIYKVKSESGEGYLYGDPYHLDYEYVERSLDGSRYAEHASDEGGEAKDIPYYPKYVKEGSDLVDIPGNEMPDVCKTLYLCAESIVDVDKYIELANSCGINAFVIDVKDGEAIAYDSPTIQKYSPSSNKGVNTFEAFRSAVKKINDAGYYTIARITVFKDDGFVKDHPDTVITYKGKPYEYNWSNWPSIFNRLVWEYNVALGVEAVENFGFNEIQFDYVRCPEYIPTGTDMKNTYNESRIEAVTKFVYYATDVLHRKGAYVSVDVFGELVGGYVTQYGQYWCALSNAADVISGMPYPDHFLEGDYGLAIPWKEPYTLMWNWSYFARERQEETYYPARMRTWIQAYNSYKDGTYYGYDKVRAQINALTDNGVNQGYMTWNGSSSLDKYRDIKDAFND